MEGGLNPQPQGFSRPLEMRFEVRPRRDWHFLHQMIAVNYLTNFPALPTFHYLHCCQTLKRICPKILYLRRTKKL